MENWLEVNKENIIESDGKEVLMRFETRNGNFYENYRGVIKVLKTNSQPYDIPLYDFISDVNIPTDLSNTKFKIL